MSQSNEMHGGVLVAELLAKQDVRFIFTLCGGHISPILVAARQEGIRVIDVRHEATAVFAADAVARLSGVPGVAAVTAGPGLTNTITAVKNAQLAQSPVVVLGGATATMLKGRGALQDIDQMALMRPHVKWARAVTRVRDIVPALEKAFFEAQAGVPGPVFVELPVDLLYQESLVRDWHGIKAGGEGHGWRDRLFQWYLKRHVNQLFAGAWKRRAVTPGPIRYPAPKERYLEASQAILAEAKRPLLLIGSQSLIDAPEAAALQEAVLALGIPTYLSGMARGLLGKEPLHIRHKRRQALKQADVLLLAGVTADFRLNYGRDIPRSTRVIGVNLSKEEAGKNRRPDLLIETDPGTFLRRLATMSLGDATRWAGWHQMLRERDEARDAEIGRQAAAETEYVNPLRLCQEMEQLVGEPSVLVGDGGDFVASVSYVVRPRGPLTWLDPGLFGTLGSGAGFALGAKLCRPEAEVWLLYGDGSAAYSLAEFDTFSRHDIPIIAVVGTDASWSQIAREQVAIFDDDVATSLVRTDYHRVAEGYGGEGRLVTCTDEIAPALREAQALAREGRPVLVNVLIGQTDFRKGSISM